MVTGVGPPPSRLGPGPDPDPGLDHLPLAERLRRLLRLPPAPAVVPSPPAAGRCVASAAAENAGGTVKQSWPGLPRGAQFNPSDSDLLWHLAAEIGNGLASRHPFINEFIKSVDGDTIFGCTHPQDILGVRQDGCASYFFHKKLKFSNNENGKYISWKQSETPTSIVLDGSLRGCKEVFVMYAYKTNDNDPQRTDWRLHQYHIKNTMEGEEELVVSKIFYKSQKKLCEWHGKAPARSAQETSVPPIVDSMGDDNNMMILDEVPKDIPISPVECFVDSNDYQAELLLSPTPACGNENTQLSVGNPETFLVDVKLEPALEGYKIYPSESQVKSHQSSDDSCLENAGSVPECVLKDRETDFGLLHGTADLTEKTSADYACSNQSTEPEHIVEGCSLVGSKKSVSSDICKVISAATSSQGKGTHAEGPLQSLGVKSELTESESPDLCKNNSINIAELTVKINSSRTLDHDGGLAYCSRERKKRKMKMSSSEKMFEENGCRNYKGVAYRSCRRKKTATDSIEQALEEDAPGLLQILLDRGIMVQEIKLYGVEEPDDILPDCTESDFQDLEDVITKLFPYRTSLLKPVGRHTKGEKAMYCLTCLISLIEQSRYLQFRDCPVEWGWCRDLQAFIFVFSSHNRIVLERPEYGYATYFFEIVQSLPVEWQLQRLVTAMKLSSCGRTALIENRPLLVGEDLTEGEAHVLEQYGWIPNTGLGSMLNYRDRVVHNRWNEKCSATDWRMKIGKLLMTGYSEGQLITNIPTKVGNMLEDTEIKLEGDPF